MAFKIKDGITIGTTAVFNDSGTLLVKAPGWITPRTVTFQDKTTAPTASTDVTGSFTIDGTANVSEVVLTLDTILSGSSKVNEPNVTYGSSSLIPVFTVDAKGRITAISETAASLQFTIAGDGSTSDVFQGGTVTVTGGTGIVTTVAETSTPSGTSITIALDSNDDVTFASVTADNVQIAPSTNTNLITTSAGDLNLDSFSGIINLGVADSDSVYIKGNLIVEGNTTTLNTATLEVEDKIITVAKNATDSSTADQSGINVAGADASMLYNNTGDKFVFNKAIESTGGIVNTVIGATSPQAGTFTSLTVNDNTTLGATTADTITLNGRFVTGTVLRSAQLDTNTLALAAYDVDGAAYVNLVTLTASNTPTLALTSGGVGTITNMSIGSSNPQAGTFTQITVNGSSVNTSISPSGTGTVTIAPAGQLSLGTSGVNTSIVGNIVANTGSQTINLSPGSTVTISPGGTLTLGTSGQTTTLSGNVSATGTQTVNLSPSGTVTISPVGATLTLGTSGQTTTLSGNLSATGTNQTINLSPTGASGTVAISPAGATLTLGASGQTTSIVGNISAITGGQTVTLSPTGAGTVTINPATAGSISNMSISATTISASSTVSLTATENATSQTTGALRVDGGVSVDKDVYLSGAQVYATSGGTKIAETRALTATVAQTAAFDLDTFDATIYRYAIYQIQITQGSEIQISEVKIAHNGTAPTMTEYAVLETSPSTPLAAAFASAISGGNVILRVSMTTSASATIKMLRTLMVI